MTNILSQPLLLLSNCFQADRYTQNQARIGGGDFAVPVHIGGLQLCLGKRVKRNGVTQSGTRIICGCFTVSADIGCNHSRVGTDFTAAFLSSLLTNITNA